MTKKISAREKLLDLTHSYDMAYFTPEKLLHEIVMAMSEQEAKEMFDHICDHHDINKGDDEDE